MEDEQTDKTDSVVKTFSLVRETDKKKQGELRRWWENSNITV